MHSTCDTSNQLSQCTAHVTCPIKGQVPHSHLGTLQLAGCGGAQTATAGGVRGPNAGGPGPDLRRLTDERVEHRAQLVIFYP